MTAVETAFSDEKIARAKATNEAQVLREACARGRGQKGLKGLWIQFHIAKVLYSSILL